MHSCLPCSHLHTGRLSQIVQAYWWQSRLAQQVVEVIQKTLGGEEVTRRCTEDQLLMVPRLTCLCASRLLVLPVAKKHSHDQGRNRNDPLTRLRLGRTYHGLAPCKEHRALHLEKVS